MHRNGGSLPGPGNQAEKTDPNIKNVQTYTEDQTMDHPAASKGTDRRIRYNESFKLDAIRLWKSSHRSAQEIARELGISAPTLYSWGRETKTVPNGTAAAQYLRELEEQIATLRDENTRIKLQCETLKKTLSILAEFPETGMGKQRATGSNRR